MIKTSFTKNTICPSDFWTNEEKSPSYNEAIPPLIEKTDQAIVPLFFPMESIKADDLSCRRWKCVEITEQGTIHQFIKNTPRKKGDVSLYYRFENKKEDTLFFYFSDDKEFVDFAETIGYQLKTVRNEHRLYIPN